MENEPVIAFSRKAESGKTIYVYINMGEDEETLAAKTGKCPELQLWRYDM